MKEVDKMAIDSSDEDVDPKTREPQIHQVNQF